MIESTQKAGFIQRTHLFRPLSDEQALSCAQKVTEKVFSPGQDIFRQGEEGESFYLIFSGSVIQSRQEGKYVRHLADLSAGDHFGEDALFHKSRRGVSITAKEPVTVLIFPRQVLDDLVTQTPALRSRFEIALSTHHLLIRRSFPWLEDGEVIRFITQKHPILLWKALIWPVFGLLLPILSLILYLLGPDPVYLWIAGLSLLVCLFASYFKWLDWSNDTFIVSNKRVLSLKKIILLYNSRQEAPLTAILSVNSQSDIVGRTFGYGDVIIRTFVGNVVFSSIGHPQEVEELLHEYWERTKKGSHQVDVEAMGTSIRQKLGLEEAAPEPEPVPPATRPAYSFNLFKIRFEEKGIITYRKHWVVWLKQTWLPGVLLLLGLALMIRDLFLYGFIRPEYKLIEIVFPVVVLVFLWWLYQTIDWSNDKFQVSADEIFDIDKKPLGRSMKNIAPLGNILNMEASRKGLLQVLFNYGNVYISVGGSNMVFEDVMKPDEVQQDIEQRRVALKDRLEHERELADRDRLAEYFAAYHNQATSLSAELEEKKHRDAGEDLPFEPKG